MRTIIIDDDKSMIIILKRLLNRIEGVTVTGSFVTADEAVAWLQTEEADLAFVDIQMVGHRDGIELASQLQEIRPNLKIVFATSHRDFALDAFDVGAFDYIVKPVLIERLEQTIKRIVRERETTSYDEAAANRLTAKCLGGMQVYGPHGEVKWSIAKSAELFAYLLVCRDKGATRAQILEDLFGGNTSRQTTDYMNTAVYQLRKTLKQHGLQTAVESINGRYKLLPRTVDADFIAFEKRLAGFEEITALNVEEAREADKLYAGDLFDDKGYMWSMFEKERLSSMYRRFALRLGNWLLEQGQIESAYPVVSKLVAINETDEEANAQMLRLYAAAKDKQAMIAHYDKYARLVQEEFGVSPGVDLGRLFERLKSE